MPSERIELVQDLFLQALEQPGEERQRWLESKCGHDAELLSEVNSLLSYHEQADDPLEETPGLASSLSRDLPRDAELPAIPGYEIVSEIGSGGQAIVYEAVQKSTTQKVALKRLRWGRFASDHEQQRFRREVVVLADLKHPNIVSIIDCVQAEDGTPFLVTELVEGDSFDRLFRSDRDADSAADRSDLLQLFLKIVRAVDYAHQRGIVHRDLKPANILIDGHTEPRILDFGLAKPAFGSTVDASEPEQLTFTGQFMGSLPWASPEQAKGDEVDARSDVYSLGVILYQIVTSGHFPYKVAGTMHDVLEEIINTQPTPPSQLVQSDATTEKTTSAIDDTALLNSEMETIIFKALAKLPEDRYQSASALAADLQRYLTGRPVEAKPEVVEPKQGMRRLVSARFVGGLLGLGIIAAIVAIIINAPAQKPARNMQSPAAVEENSQFEPTWISLGSDLAELVESGAVRRTDDGWRIGGQEVVLPRATGRHLAVRARVRRIDVHQPLTVLLRSSSGMEARAMLHVNHELRVSGPPSGSHADATFDLPVAADAVVELILQTKDNGAVAAVDGKPVIELHFPVDGTWQLVIDASRGEVECHSLEYCELDDTESLFPDPLPTGEQQAVQRALALGGSASSRVGRDGSLRLVRILGVRSPKVEDFDVFARCSALSDLSLEQFEASSAALERLSSIQTLERLTISSSKLGQDCLQQISRLKNLWGLNLWGSRIESADFRPLRDAPLMYLTLPHSPVTDEQVEQIAGIASLEELRLSGEGITSDAIPHFQTLRKLKLLELSGARISGRGVEHLVGLPSLTELDLKNSDVNDGDVAHLRRMTNLSILRLEGTKLSPQGLEQIRQALPNCHVTGQ